MDTGHFESWLRNIYNTLDEEISCTECFDLVSGFVDLELSGGEPAVIMPLVKQHLEQCAACREEYETLHDLRRCEEDGGDLSLDELRGLIQ